MEMYSCMIFGLSERFGFGCGPETGCVGRADDRCVRPETFEPWRQQFDAAPFVVHFVVVARFLPAFEPIEILGPIGMVIVRIARTQ